MDKIYFLVSTCETWLNKDGNGYLNNYFIDEGGFTNALLIAIAVAVVAAIVFYGVIGMKFNRLANLAVWLVTLAADAIVTFFVTQLMIIGSRDGNTGIFQSITNFRGTKLQEIPVDNIQGRTDLSNATDQLVNLLSNGCDVTTYLNVTNVVLAVVVFFVISICVKGITIHAKHVPF